MLVDGRWWLAWAIEEERPLDGVERTTMPKSGLTDELGEGELVDSDEVGEGEEEEAQLDEGRWWALGLCWPVFIGCSGLWL